MRISIRVVIFLIFMFFPTTIRISGFYFDPPELDHPADDERYGFNSTAPLLMWEDQGLESYEIELAIDPDFLISTGPIVSALPSFDMSALIPDDLWQPIALKLFWRVRGIHSLSIASDWSEGRFFFKTLLDSPSLVSPVTDARFGYEPPFPFFQWTSSENCKQYEIEFSYDAAFVSPLARITLAENSLDFSTADPDVWFPLEGIFFWRVAGIDENTFCGPWSGGHYFIKTRLFAPQLIWPGDETRFPPQSEIPAFEWRQLDDSMSYEIRFSLDIDGDDALGIIPLPSTEFDLSPFLTQQDWWYAYANLFWAVAGIDSQGRSGPWSECREFSKTGFHRIAVFGDSITFGECVTNGYLDILADYLQPRWGRLSTANKAIPGTKAGWGEYNIEKALIDACPEYILILFGTNDTVDPYGCNPPYECNVDGHLKAMADIAWRRGTTPIVSTILPLNPDGKFAGAQPRMDEYNDAIRNMATQYGVPIVDLDERFKQHQENLPDYFCDWGHPNYAGYEIMADAYYNGIIAHGG